jgi:hypothetical protein
MPKKKTAPSGSIVSLSGANALDRVIGVAPAPLLPGEVQTDYMGVAARIVAVAQPRDAIEEFLTRDAVDLTWEILRMRRMKAGLLRARATKGVGRILSTIGEKDKFPRDVFDGPDFAQKWASGDASTRREFMQILKRAELSMDDVMAEALAKKIDTFERIDRIACLQARRRAATTPCARLIVTAQRWAPRCDKRSMKSRTWSFETSKPAKQAESRRLDQRPPTVRESRQREIEHRAEDRDWKGAFRAKRVVSRLESLSPAGHCARAAGRSDRVRDCRS